MPNKQTSPNELCKNDTKDNTFLPALIPMKLSIDPMQKWLPLNYSFVRIQNSLTNLIQNSKFFMSQK